MSTPFTAASTLLFYLALAAVLLWATSRFVRPLTLTAALVLAALPLVFTGPALVTAGVYAPIDFPYLTTPLKPLRAEHGLDEDSFSRTRYDVAFQMIPWRKATRYAIKHGEWPVWNPFMLSGDVLAAAAQPAVYHPIHVVSYLLPLAPSLTFVAAAVFLTAAISAFCFNRELGCREPAALVGAAAWTFCGFNLFWLGWPHTLTVAVFPLLLLAVQRVVADPGRRSVALLATALVLVLLAGHPESAFHCVAVGAAYGVAELLAVPRARWPRAVGASTLAGVLALLLSAVYLLPFLDAMPQTREHFLRAAFFAGSDRSVPWGEALSRMRHSLFPFVNGSPWSEWIEPDGVPTVASAYAGSVLWAPALFGLWRGRTWRRWLLLALAAFGALVHASAPGVTDLLSHLPLFDLAINNRLAFVAAFCVSALAALGVEAWARAVEAGRVDTGQRTTSWRTVSWRRLGGPQLLGWLTLATLAVLAVLITLFWPELRLAGLSVGYVRLQTVFELAPLAVLAAVFLSVRSVRVGAGCLLVLLLAQRAVQTHGLNPTYPRSLFYPPVAALAALPQDGEPFRIIGLGPAFTPNMSALYELEDPRGYEAMTNMRLYKTYRLWSGTDPRFAHNAWIGELTWPFLSFLNVRYAMVNDGFRKTAGWREMVKGRGYSIYENPGVLPRAFVPRQVRLGVPERQTLREMENETDFARVAWIGERLTDGLGDHFGAEAPAAGAIRQEANGPGTVAVERRGLRLFLDVDMERPGWVTVSQTAWRGWRARAGAAAGDRELPLHVANVAFLAFHLDAGHHAVELVFRPRSFVLGRGITFLTAGALLALGAAALVRRRRGLPH